MGGGCDANHASGAQSAGRCRGTPGSPSGRANLRTEAGQGTVEWIGLVLLLVASSLAALALLGGVPGASLAGAIAERIVCAANLGGACAPSGLSEAYGPEVAALVAEHAPAIRYEPGMRALPVRPPRDRNPQTIYVTHGLRRRTRGAGRLSERGRERTRPAGPARFRWRCRGRP